MKTITIIVVTCSAIVLSGCMTDAQLYGNPGSARAAEMLLRGTDSYFQGRNQVQPRQIQSINCFVDHGKNTVDALCF